MRTQLALLRAAIVALPLAIAGCGESGTTTSSASPSGSTAAKPAASNKTAASSSGAPSAKAPVSSGPMFKAKMMGMDMSKPLVDTSLDKGGLKGLSLQAPEGAEVEEDKLGGGAKVVAAGVNYSIVIRPDAFSQDARKKAMTALDPDGKFITDTADLVVFQRKSGSVLFGMGVTVGDKKYSCSTVATATDFDQATIDQTIASCKTLKSSGAAPATSASAAPSSAPSAK